MWRRTIRFVLSDGAENERGMMVVLGVISRNAVWCLPRRISHPRHPIGTFLMSAPSHRNFYLCRPSVLGFPARFRFPPQSWISGPGVSYVGPTPQSSSCPQFSGPTMTQHDTISLVLGNCRADCPSCCGYLKDHATNLIWNQVLVIGFCSETFMSNMKFAKSRLLFYANFEEII